MNTRDAMGVHDVTNTTHNERIGAFIDGPDLQAMAKILSIDLDYKKLLNIFRSRGRLLRAFYYAAVNDEIARSPHRPLLDWLDYNGYSVFAKKAREYIDHRGSRKIKGNIDIDLAIDVMDSAPYLDHIFLISGNGDFRRLVQQVQRDGLRVTVISTIRCAPSMVADLLRRQADTFVDLMDLAPAITRAPARRTDRAGTLPPRLTKAPGS